MARRLFHCGRELCLLFVSVAHQSPGSLLSRKFPLPYIDDGAVGGKGDQFVDSQFELLRVWRGRNLLQGCLNTAGACRQPVAQKHELNAVGCQ